MNNEKYMVYNMSKKKKMDFKLVLKVIKVVYIRENQLGMNHIFLIFHMFFCFYFQIDIIKSREKKLF